VQVGGQTYFFFAPMLIPLFILGVPIFDTFLAIVRRAAKRSGVASADKEHIHHRLMRLGHGQRRSVLILWAWTLLLSLLVLYPAYIKEGNGIVPIGLAALGLALFTVLHPGARESRAERRNGTAETKTVRTTSGDPAPVVSAATIAAPVGPVMRLEASEHDEDAPRIIAPGVTVSRVPERSSENPTIQTPEQALAALDATTPRQPS